jgi:tripartite-type tricarboxylate transporter receptor subunit TctC
MDRRHALLTLGAAASATLQPVFAQEKYPSRAAKIVVPYTAGGVTDIAARAVGDLLTSKHGQPVIVENKPGAGGVIGMQYVASARPDGYTLLTGGLGSNVLPPVTIEGLPLDIVKSLVPVAQVAEFVNVLVVRRDHPANSVAELVRSAKSGANPLLYATNGVGSSSHLTGEFFGMKTGVKVTPVPYKGSSELLVDVVSGNVEMTFGNLPAVFALVRDGRLKALAVTSTYRAKKLPEVPTMQEAGVPDFNVTSWLGIYAPAATPTAIVAQLGNDIAEGLKSPENLQRLEAAAFEAKPLDAAGFQRVNQLELERWGALARALDIRMQYGKG